MVSQVILNLLITPLNALLNLLPVLDISFIEKWDYICEVLKEIFYGVGCLLPLKELMPLVYFQIGLWEFKFGYAVLLRIKSLLPFWGGT